MEKRFKIKIPALPNFLLTERDEPIPVADFTEEELREVGGEWVEKLVKKSKKTIES